MCVEKEPTGQRLLRLCEAKLPRQSAAVNAGPRSGARPPVAARHGDVVRLLTHETGALRPINRKYNFRIFFSKLYVTFSRAAGYLVCY